jgi:hypothetical protein
MSYQRRSTYVESRHLREKWEHKCGSCSFLRHAGKIMPNYKKILQLGSAKFRANNSSFWFAEIYFFHLLQGDIFFLGDTKSLLFRRETAINVILTKMDLDSTMFGYLRCSQLTLIPLGKVKAELNYLDVILVENVLCAFFCLTVILASCRVPVDRPSRAHRT